MVAFPFFLVGAVAGVFVIGAALAGGFLLYRGTTRREPVFAILGVILLLFPCLIGGGGLFAWLTAAKRVQAVPPRPEPPIMLTETGGSVAIELPPAERSLIEFRMEAAEDVVAAWQQNGNVPVGTRVCTLPGGASGQLLLGDLPVLDAGDVAEAAAAPSDYDPHALEITFTDRGKRTLATVTAAGINRRLAIFYRTRLISAPVIREAITGGTAQISGLGSATERDELIQALRRH